MTLVITNEPSLWLLASLAIAEHGQIQGYLFLVSQRLQRYPNTSFLWSQLWIDLDAVSQYELSSYG